MRCPNCQTVNPPQAKFCLECGNRLVVCPNCGTVNFPAAKFCMECGTPLPQKAETAQPAHLQRLPQPIQTLSNGQQLMLQASGEQTQSLPEGLATPEERRVVTIMFADITGSTPLADRLDPEDMRAILTGYFNLMTEQIRRHGGTVEKYIGDAVMAVFGAPVAHEDDPDRAIRAALDMQAALNDFNRQRQARDPEAARLQMRIGINTGEVAAPSGAQSGRRDFLITGDAVNVAARLQQIATPDTILVGERTYLATREVFDFRPIAPLYLKGKPEPLAAWVVLGIHKHTLTIPQHPRGIEGLHAPFIGRTLELALMQATYARVQAERRPHLITLLGAPGIGKSRLIQEFIAREEETARCTSCEETPPVPRVLQGRCPPYGEGITYWPLIEILRSLLSVQDEESDGQLQNRFVGFVRETLSEANRTEEPERIATAILESIRRKLSGKDRGTDGRSERGSRPWDIQRTTLRSSSRTLEQSKPQVEHLRAWRVLFEALAVSQPLILVIDDLQWADEELLGLLDYLADRITNVPILFLCPARPDFFERRRDWGGGRRNFSVISLESLSREEGGELLNDLLHNDELPEVLRQTILSRAEGNPFFVEEIARMLIDQKVLVYEEGDKGGYWRISPQHEALLSELASPAVHPGDTLINVHYVLPLPRLPDTIQGVLAARIDLLSPIEKRVLQHAAIIGRTFWLAGLYELAADLSPDTLFETLDSLIQRDFIVEVEKQGRSPFEHDRIFSFKHILIRNVVYNNIPRVRRSQEHAQLALRLEEQTAGNTEMFAELLAYHYKQALAMWSASLLTGAGETSETKEDTLEAGPTQVRLPHLTRPELRERTIRYLTLAGDQAYHTYYTIRAIQAYSDALDLLIESDADSLTLARTHEKLGDAYAQRADADEAWQEYRKALQLMLEAPQHDKTELVCLYDCLAELPTRWLRWFKNIPDWQEVQSYIDAGLNLLEGQPLDRRRVGFLTYQALLYIRQVWVADRSKRTELAEQAVETGREALSIAEELNDASSLWLTLDALGFIYLKQHKYQDAHKAQHRRLTLTEQIKHREELLDLYISLGYAHGLVSDYPTAAMWCGRAEQIAQTMESPSMLLRSMVVRMEAWYYWNRWDDAREVALRVLQTVEQYQEDEVWQLEALEALANIAYRTGDQEEGDSYSRQFKRLIDQKLGHGVETEVLINMRSIYLAREEWGRALADCREALQWNEPLPSPELLAIFAELVVITGESMEVQQATCERAVLVAEESGERRSVAIALRARGRMHLEQQNWAAAEQDLRQALNLCEVLDLPWQQGQSLYCLGLFYRRRADALNKDNPAEREIDLSCAHLYFEQAPGFFEFLKAVHDAERARLALAQDSKAPV